MSERALLSPHIPAEEHQHGIELKSSAEHIECVYPFREGALLGEVAYGPDVGESGADVAQSGGDRAYRGHDVVAAEADGERGEAPYYDEGGDEAG